MEISTIQEAHRIHRLPQSKYVDAVRWLPPVSALDRYAALALFDSDSGSSSVEINYIDAKPSSDPNVPPVITPEASWTSNERISSLKIAASFKPLIAAATFSGSLHILAVDLVEDAAVKEVYVAEGKDYHVGCVAAVDWKDGGGECVSVGEDGRVNLVSVDGGGLRYKRVYDANGLVGYSAVKWASPTEFVTGGYGFNLQWWDQRKPGVAVSQFKGNWSQGKISGIIHSLDIHPSRKHTCLVGGSLGTVFAWDLRWPQQPIVLSGAGVVDSATQPLSESEVWEVQYDPYTNCNVSSSRILPAMICSEDGILAIVEQGEQSVELLSEPCAINCFDIDKQNPSDVLCGLEWESVAVVARSQFPDKRL